MIYAKDRTIDYYKLVGAYARLCTDVLTKTQTMLGYVLPKASHANKLWRIGNTFRGLKSDAEDQMSLDHPELSVDYTSVFFGSTTTEPTNEIDIEVQELVIRITEELLKKQKAARELALTKRHR